MQGSSKVTCPVCEHSFFPALWILSWCLCSFHVCLQRTFLPMSTHWAMLLAGHQTTTAWTAVPTLRGPVVLSKNDARPLLHQAWCRGGATSGHRSCSAKQAFMKMLGLPATSPVLPWHLVHLNLGSSCIFIEVSKISTNKVLRILLST